MTPKEYNYGSFVRGDTIPKRRFTITKTINSVTAPIDLSDYTIRCDFLLLKDRISKVEGEGITIIDAINGVFEIDKFTLSKAGKYQFDIEFKDDSNDIVQTYVKGDLEILEDVTK